MGSGEPMLPDSYLGQDPRQPEGKRKGQQKLIRCPNHFGID